MSAEKQRRLGRGLEALIGAAQPASTTPSDLQRIPTSRIRPKPYQPRREFDPTALAELEASISANGLLQPITVRRKGDNYELIAGERRLRAVRNLGWKDVPAVVRDFDEQTMLVLALVENLQRADLNPIEEARGYQQLLGEFSLTHQEVADAVGKDRSTITNLLRVLTLPDHVQRLVESGKLSSGHARTLVGMEHTDALAIADQIVSRNLSVRQTEGLVKNLRAAPASAQRKPDAADQKRSTMVRQLEDELRHYLQTDVHVELSGDAKGAVRISFYSPDDLERLMGLIVRNRSQEIEA